MTGGYDSDNRSSWLYKDTDNPVNVEGNIVKTRPAVEHPPEKKSAPTRGGRRRLAMPGAYRQNSSGR